MDQALDWLNDNICKNTTVMCIWVLALTIVVLYLLLSREGFRWKDHDDAPIPRQRGRDQLGIGSVSRYASEFSGTNQGGSNIFGDIAQGMQQENLTSEPSGPNFYTVDKELDDFRHGGESFSNKSMFIEPFAADPEERLKGVLHGGN